MTSPVLYKKVGGVDYLIRDAFKPHDGKTYEVSKFDWDKSDQPLTKYTVVYDGVHNKGKCNCPAGEFRRMGPNDKHVKMVAAWLANGRSF